MEKNMDEIVKENMVNMLIEPVGPRTYREVQIDERTFVDKKFETKLLKHLLEKYKALYSKAKNLENRYKILITYISGQFKFHGLEVFVGLRVDEKIISFTFEVWDSEKDIYIECMKVNNQFLFEDEILNVDKEKELKENLNRLREIIKKDK